MISAERFGIKPVIIKISAIQALIIKIAVQNNADSELFRIAYECIEIVFRSQQLIDFHVIACIVTMIGICLENRIQINYCYV